MVNESLTCAMHASITDIDEPQRIFMSPGIEPMDRVSLSVRAYKDAMIHSLFQSQMLVLPDIGVKRGSCHVFLFTTIDHRHFCCKTFFFIGDTPKRDRDLILILQSGDRLFEIPYKSVQLLTCHFHSDLFSLLLNYMMPHLFHTASSISQIRLSPQALDNPGLMPQ